MRFLFVDDITELTLGVMARGVKRVTADDYYLRQDKAGQWCFIPTLIGEALGQLAAWNVMASNDFLTRPVAGIAACALLHRTAYVGETLLLEVHIDRLDSTAVQYHGEASIGDEVVFSLEGALGPLLPMANFIDDHVVRQQFSAIHPSRRLHQEPTNAPAAEPLRSPPMTFDNIIACEPGAQLIAEKYISHTSPYFADHFPNKPVLPMTVLLECLINLADEFVARAGYQGTYVCKKMRRVKMSDFIIPGDRLMGSLVLKNKTDTEFSLVCRCEVSGKRVGTLELIMGLRDE
jgi:3-hydroxymyristoyl/3-hydroxydecanoyl-(acyl carrier protein) dehydratase